MRALLELFHLAIFEPALYDPRGSVTLLKFELMVEGYIISQLKLVIDVTVH
jgi:hypothetical protein